MKIDVVGGSGFIGNKFCEYLSKSSKDFRILDIQVNPTFSDKTKICDVTNILNLRENISGDIIVNLAAVHRDDVRPLTLYDEVNINGAENICKIASEKYIHKMIFISSVAVYGFAEPNSDETCEPNPFNDYGRTKLEAEKIYKKWLESDSRNSLTIIRPTVVFGEKNRGNVYNFLSLINRKFFPMIGNGKNFKSMAYVNNVASFIEFSLDNKNKFNLYNYIDKPDLSTSEIVSHSREFLGMPVNPTIKIPYFIALIIGYFADALSFILRTSFPISAIRVKKFCANSQFATSIEKSGFQAKYNLKHALKNTIEYEFLEKKDSDQIFNSE